MFLSVQNKRIYLFRTRTYLSCDINKNEIADRGGRHDERQRVRRNRGESRRAGDYRRPDRSGNAGERDGVWRMRRARPRAHCPLRRRSNLAL